MPCKYYSKNICPFHKTEHDVKVEINTFDFFCVGNALMDECPIKQYLNNGGDPEKYVGQNPLEKYSSLREVATQTVIKRALKGIAK